MISIIIFSGIIAQTIVAIYLLNTLKLKDDFEKNLNIVLIILFFHLGVKFFLLVVLKNFFLFSNNATGFGLSYGPLLYITARLFVQKRPGSRLVFFHLLPFLLFTSLYLINSVGNIFHIIPSGFIIAYASVYQWLVTASLLIYPVITNKLLSKHIVRYDPAAGAKVKLLKSMGYVMVMGVSFGLLASLISFIIKGYNDFDLRLLPYTCLAIIPVLILRYKMHSVVIPSVAARPEHEEVKPGDIIPVEKRYKKSALDTEMMNEYEISLTKFIQKSKIYLEAEISLEELSDKTKIPKHHLTQLLNERFGKNFYTFINEYRINEAIQKLKDPDTGTNILSLAFDCGFNSKSSFNNYFKKVTGLTPSAYRKERHLQFSEED